MRLKNNNSLLTNSFVHLHGADWLQHQRVAGKCWREVFAYLCDLIHNNQSLSLRELDRLGGEKITSQGFIPTFLGYKGFPGNLCLSVNKELVHGIGGDRHLQDGDLLTIDFGVTVEGAIADAASTILIGNPKSEQHTKLIAATQECLSNTIKSVKVGERIGNIGYVIHRTAQKNGFNVINSFGGHGLDWNRPHAFLFVPNKSEPGEGIVIQPGLTLAIEPLLVPATCSVKTKIAEDGWTVLTEDIGAHEEATIFIHEDRVEIIAGGDYLYAKN